MAKKLDRDGTCLSCGKTGMTQVQLAEHECNDEDKEQAKATANYNRQVTNFRNALNKGDKVRARGLTRLYDWPSDEIEAQFIAWLED